ncbi:1,4-dihydroxy-2-naphthoate octaprenyltransferase [Allomuricauda sp. d1]|uniref:1,4-dihydroxy-2-naphthoate octaprenyltransferase n=1 Tax=Allomuricauda sp. d1 TaxID=3136725 RepID=UPI0031D36C19
MATFKSWLYAARLRTLPLSISGIVVGTAMAHAMGFTNFGILILSLLTTVAFQVTSNFANDYGDGVRGTDNELRIGPKRALQSGMLSQSALKNGIFVSSVISILLAIALIYSAFGLDKIPYAVFFLVLGALSIWAAIRYTVGQSAYGYRGLGDLFVFLFFGLVSVLGSFFLYVGHFKTAAVFPAISIGLLSVGVLNLNNLRDVDSDKIHGKNTLIVKMGFERGKVYHAILVVIAFISFIVYGMVEILPWQGFMYLLAFVPIFMHLRRVLTIKQPSQMDPELKKLALSTFLSSVLFYISINYFF